MDTPAVGTPAPDLMLTATDESSVRLTQMWEQRPTLFFFLRHFGCAICRAELRRLRRSVAAFESRDAQIVLITPVDAVGSQRFAALEGLTFPVLADPGRRSYRAFGLEEGTLWHALGPEVLVRQAAEALRGNLPYVDPRGAPLRQLGGVFIVDRSGVVRFSHMAVPIFNYPPVSDYLKVFDELLAEAQPL